MHGILFIHTLYKTVRFLIGPPLKNSLFALSHLNKNWFLLGHKQLIRDH